MRTMPSTGRRSRAAALFTAAVLAAACTGDIGQSSDEGWDNLRAVANPDRYAAEQPERAHPYAVAITPSGRALVTLRGSELHPGNTLAVIDLAGRRVSARLRVGDRPVAVRMHPGGRFAVVLSQLSRFAAVVDVDRMRVSGRLELGYYAQELAFSPDGARMWVSNRVTDTVDEYALAVGDDGLAATWVRSAAAGINPGAIALSSDGASLYVADLGGLAVRVFDAAGLVERAVVPIDAPVFDLRAMGAFMVVATLNDTSGLPCAEDPDYPGEEGDGVFAVTTDRTCSRGFADIQNEIAFIDASDQVAVRYTSDTAEVSEADREGDHDPALMKVVGALPQSIAVVGADRAYVTMGASFELSEMSLDLATDPARPGLEMPRQWDTGLAPRGLAIDAEGARAVVANMLGDSVSIIDLDSGQRSDVDLGPSGPAFPATRAEVGQLFFFTSRYSTDGDQGCVHCHPDGDADGKSWGVEVVRAYGRRATIPAHNLAATMPLLVEGVFNERDFSLEVEGIAFRPDFHDSSYVYQVERRDAFFREVSDQLFGDEVGYDEMIEDIGAFLVAEPRLLPSPFPADTDQVARGRSLYFRFDVGCAFCHPSPSFSSPQLFEGMVSMARFDRPRRSIDPNTSIKFLENARDGFFNANSLRGLWDRRGALLHDGRARTIREVLLTPGHPCLREGEQPRNQNLGRPDSHAGISHLDCDEIDDLIAFLMTIQ